MHEPQKERVDIHLHVEGMAAVLQLGERIMSAISDFVTAQKQFNTDTGTAIDSIVVSQAGLTGDIASLNQKITDIQNSPGTLSPADQASLDGLQADGKAMAVKAKSVADALAALDALTPPAVPPVPAP